MCGPNSLKRNRRLAHMTKEGLSALFADANKNSREIRLVRRPGVARICIYNALEGVMKVRGGCWGLKKRLGTGNARYKRDKARKLTTRFLLA